MIRRSAALPEIVLLYEEPEHKELDPAPYCGLLFPLQVVILKRLLSRHMLLRNP